MKILITDGENRAALAATRALGRAGHEVFVAAAKHPSLASASRFCSRALVWPDPSVDSQSFVEALLHTASREPLDIVIPMTEITTLLVCENKHRLEPLTSVPFPEFSIVATAANKAEVHRMAEKENIPIPRTFFLDRPEDFQTFQEEAHDFTFPLVIKPARSRVRGGHGWKAFGVRYAQDMGHLTQILGQTLGGDAYPILLQERVRGDGSGIFLCMQDGVTVASFAHRRLREKPPSGGVSVLRESVAPDPVLLDYSERLLRRMNWQGVAMVEFKHDRDLGRAYLMEINGRFWGSLQLAIDAGVNFPLLAVDIARGRAVPPLKGYRVGVRTRWLWGDVDVLLARIFKSEKELCLPAGYPCKSRLFMEFMKFLGSDLHYEILDPKDIGPWLHETRCWFSRLISKKS